MTKLLDQSKKEHVESIKILNSTHQANIDCLKIKLKELSENIKEKENEDSRKYQQYIEMKDKYSQLLQEKEAHINQIKELSMSIQEKNKKIEELLASKESLNQLSISETNTNVNTNMCTNGMTLSLPLDEDIIYYKKIDKGMRCIFVPFVENILVCINLSENLVENKSQNDMCPLSNYECKYILDLNSFNKELSKLIVDNSLIVIGKISKLTELEQNKNKFYNLPEDKKFVLVTLGKVDYVIGFPENELMFNNYIIKSN